MNEVIFNTNFKGRLSLDCLIGVWYIMMQEEKHCSDTRATVLSEIKSKSFKKYLITSLVMQTLKDASCEAGTVLARFLATTHSLH